MHNEILQGSDFASKISCGSAAGVAIQIFNLNRTVGQADQETFQVSCLLSPEPILIFFIHCFTSAH